MQNNETLEDNTNDSVMEPETDSTEPEIQEGQENVYDSAEIAEDERLMDPEIQELIQKEAKKQSGQAAKAARLQERARWERQSAAYSQNPYQENTPEGMIFDEETGEYVEIDSYAGQHVLRKRKIRANKEWQQQQKTQLELNQTYEALTDNLREYGADKPEFDAACQSFVQNGTDVMAHALAGVDNPGAIIDYYKDKPQELQRLSRLSPQKQQREIYHLEGRLQPAKKLITKAQPQISKTNANKNLASRSNDQSFQQRVEHYRRKA